MKFNDQMRQALVASGARLMMLEVRQALRVAEQTRNIRMMRALMERADAILTIMGTGP